MIDDLYVDFRIGFHQLENLLIECVIFLFANDGDEGGFFGIRYQQACTRIRLIAFIEESGHLEINHASLFF